MRKHRSWHEVRLFPVGISSWIGDQAWVSSLFGHRNVTVIGNAIDVEFWMPTSKGDARRSLGIPEDKLVVLFVALNIADTRKGFSHFVDACRVLSGEQIGVGMHAVVVGTSTEGDRVDLGVSAQFLGSLADNESIRRAYAAADVTVVPSTEEAFGKTAVESLACGTPVVCFDATGLVDIVDHKSTGHRALPFEPDNLADGVRWVLESRERWKKPSEAARNAAAGRFSLVSRARDDVGLYDRVLGAGMKPR